MATETLNPQAMQGGPERLRPFVATPERVGQYLELNHDEVVSQMKSVDGRQQLLARLMEHEDDIRQVHTDFAPEGLQSQLEAAGEALRANERYLQEVRAPEKKSLFSRAWGAIKAFPKKHPYVTAALAAAAVAGSIAAGFYFTGNWELLMSATGLSKIMSGAEAAGELVPPTPSTPILPDGGLFDIPPPTSPPGLGETI